MFRQSWIKIKKLLKYTGRTKTNLLLNCFTHRHLHTFVAFAKLETHADSHCLYMCESACVSVNCVCGVCLSPPAENKPPCWEREDVSSSLCLIISVSNCSFNPPITLNIRVCLKSQLSFISLLLNKLQLTDPFIYQMTADLRGFMKQKKNQSHLPTHREQKLWQAVKASLF